jgi:hypothetical protein
VIGNATDITRRALADSGIDLVASCGVAAYNARAPESLRSPVLLPEARGVVVAGSAGPALWRRFRSRIAADRGLSDGPHPYDAFVAETLGRADDALRAAGVRFLRFEAASQATVPVDFIALAQLVGLGSLGPFGLLIHPEHGAWWALRGAWLVDADVDPPLETNEPCPGCPAPCVGGWQNSGTLVRATPEVRGRCVVGQSSRYDDDQIAYHYDRAATVARLKSGSE